MYWTPWRRVRRPVETIASASSAIGIRPEKEAEVYLVGRWVGGWVGNRKIEENEAVRMGNCEVWVGGWVAGKRRR